MHIKDSVQQKFMLASDAKGRPSQMSYQTILVNIDLDGPVAPIVTLATDMARRCKSKLVGYCAANAPMATLLSPEGDVLTYELWQQRRREIEQKLKELQSGFRAVVGSAVRAEWRYAMGNPTSCLASAARLADLIITNAPQGAASGDECPSSGNLRQLAA